MQVIGINLIAPRDRSSEALPNAGTYAFVKITQSLCLSGEVGLKIITATSLAATACARSCAMLASDDRQSRDLNVPAERLPQAQVEPLG